MEVGGLISYFKVLRFGTWQWWCGGGRVDFRFQHSKVCLALGGGGGGGGRVDFRFQDSKVWHLVHGGGFKILRFGTLGGGGGVEGGWIFPCICRESVATEEQRH